MLDTILARLAPEDEEVSMCIHYVHVYSEFDKVFKHGLNWLNNIVIYMQGWLHKAYVKRYKGKRDCQELWFCWLVNLSQLGIRES